MAGIQHVAVIGAGAMGAGIAQVAAQAGFRVSLFDLAVLQAEQAVQRIADALDKRVARGKLSATERDGTVSRLHCVSQLAEIADADLVIEAIVENLAVKQSLFRDLAAICREDCLLASNTSSISITAIACAVNRPDRVVGLHFFNPAPVMKLVEVIRGIATSAQTAQMALDWARQCGKQAVLARSTPGFIVNRIARPFYAEALRALEEQVAEPVQLDYLMRHAGGFNMGPFELMDLIGHDVNYAVTSSVFEACYQDRRYLPSLIQKELVDAGYLGRKTGKGFYDYAEDAPQPALNLLLPGAGASQSSLAARKLGQWLPADHGLLELVANQLTLEAKATNATDVTVATGSAQLAAVTFPAESGPARLEVNGVLLVPTRGESATMLAARFQQPVVTVDYCRDYRLSPVIALAPAAQNTPEQTRQAIAFFQALGKQVLLLKDYPGMVVWRTVAMLVNETLDLANKGGASLADIDTAMCFGVNYPQGPAAWGCQLGWSAICDTLDGLTAFYGEERYRPSPMLREFAMINKELV